jgi:hypothetical protein
MVQRICFTLRKVEGDDGQRHNLFHSTCTIGGKVCKLLIDGICFKNMVTEKSCSEVGPRHRETPYTISLGVAKEGK